MADTYMSHRQEAVLYAAYRPGGRPPTELPASPAFAVAAQEVRRAARLGDPHPLLDPLGDVAAGQSRREFAGRGDGAGGGRAVRDHHGAAHSEQDRAAVGFRLEAMAELAPPAPLQNRAEPRRAGGR